MPGPGAAGEQARPAPESGRLISGYLIAESDPKPLKWSAVGALVFHFLLFFLIIPKSEPEPIRLDPKTAATIVKRYKPPSPPAQARKTKVKKTNPVPIPDPTPDEPEPIVDEASDVDFGEFDTEFVVGLPQAPPGAGSAWEGALRMGDGGVLPPVLVHQVLPEYTPEATRAGIQGEVYIEAVVTIDGEVTEPKLLRGLADEQLNERALAAVLNWRFKPGMKDGEPVPVIAMFTVSFRIH